MNEYDVQYHLTHRQKDFQVDSAYQRTARFYAHNSLQAKQQRRKIKRMLTMIVSLMLAL